MYGHAKELWLEKFSEVRKKEETEHHLCKNMTIFKTCKFWNWNMNCWKKIQYYNLKKKKKKYTETWINHTFYSPC